MKRKCETCEWFEPKGEDKREGECRGDLPFRIQGMAQNLAGQQIPVVLGAWPMLSSDRWCKEWTPRTEDGHLDDGKDSDSGILL